ncbi:hypothetical protein N9B05_02710 [Mariniblastus sp.]|nr:hypothetical protein [Mariniblastus sp.]
MKNRSSKPLRVPKITAKKIVGAVIIVLIIAYQWYAESTPPRDAAVTSQPGISSATTSKTPDNGTATLTGSYLRDGRGENLLSPAGLVYSSGRSGHRSKHVMRHASDEPDRPGPHGVFDAQGDDVFRLIDEAYELIQSGSKRVQTIPEENGKVEYVINMNRRIGYLGGESGARKNHPPLEKLNLVLGDNRVITAYPY